MIMTIDMVTGEVTSDSCLSHRAEPIHAPQTEIYMPRDLDTGLQTYDNCITHNTNKAIPENLINKNVEHFIQQMDK